MASQIVDGPSKFDFMLSLFDGGPFNPRMILFHVRGEKGEGTIQVEITGADRTDASRDLWSFRGFRSDPKTPGNVVGNYNTHTRRGEIDQKDLKPRSR